MPDIASQSTSLGLPPPPPPPSAPPAAGAIPAHGGPAATVPAPGAGAAGTPPGPTPDERLTTLEKSLGDILGTVRGLAQPVYKPGQEPGRVFGAPHVTSGPVGQDSAGYSLVKAAGYCLGIVSPDRAKEEIHVAKRLRELYGQYMPVFQDRTFLIPASTRFLVTVDGSGNEMPELVKFVGEIREKMAATVVGFDPDEARERFRGEYAKAFGTISDVAGGSLVAPPMLGDLIDLQRNMEVFPNAGATEVALPPNGRISFPKLTGGATAYWVGEGNAFTESQPTTGSLFLEAKKLGLLVTVSNELFRFTGPSTEGMLRVDMARQGALKADLSMLEGTGGTQIKGLITYPSNTVWVQGTDPLLAYTVTSNLFQPNDAADMEALLPDQSGDPTAWVMRRNLWSKIRNRRWDTITAADGKGGFVFDLTRSAADGIPLELEGVKVVRSSQVSNTRGTGTQTYVILGNFRDWIIARFGVMELMANPWGTGYPNDQTVLRAIQTLDAGPRHAASFCFADALTIS